MVTKGGWLRMKRNRITAILLGMLALGALVAAGCVPAPQADQREIDIIKELQEIEKQLEVSENAANESANDTKLLDESITEQPTEQQKPVSPPSEQPTAEPPKAEEPKVDTSKLQRIEVQETEVVKLNVETEDPDKDTITRAFSPPLGADGTWKTDYGDAGEYVITVTASDGKQTAEQKVVLVVKKKNVAPTITELPTTLKLKEGETAILKPKVTDLNKDPVTVSYSAPLKDDGSWATDHKSAGEYEILITASDGEAETKAKLTLTVLDVNLPPEISGVEDKITIKEGETVTIKPQVRDADGDKAAVSISDPVGDDGVWQTTYTDHGTYRIAITASDGKGTSSKDVQLVVEDVNVPPRITSIRKG